MKPKPLPPLDLIKERITYDPDTGVCTRLTATPHADAGSTIEPGVNPYLHIKIDGCRYKVHRLCWYLHTGEDPGEMTIDHIDGNPSNNRFSNLRLATQDEQMQNINFNRNITFDGITQSLSRWARHLNMAKTTLFNRFRRGWSIERALTEPVKRGRRASA